MGKADTDKGSKGSMEDEEAPMETDGGGPGLGSVESMLTKDPSKLTAPIPSIRDKYELLPAFLK
eukprot:scaffold216868_cov43-Prasinocladus_malaysianus.AAC.1